MVIDLIDEIGIDATDAGLFSESWPKQTGKQAYCRDLDKNTLKIALADYDISKRAANLTHAKEMAL